MRGRHGGRRVVGEIQGPPRDRGGRPLEDRGRRGAAGLVARHRGRGSLDRHPVPDQADRRLHFDRGKLASLDDLLGHDPGLHRHGAGDDHLGRIEVFLQEHRRDGQHVPVVVETVARVVGGKLLLRVVIHAQQRLHRVAVFDAIEPAHGHTAGIGTGRIEFKDGPLDEGAEAVDVRLLQIIIVGRRHDPRTGVAQDAQPELVILQGRLVLERVQVHPALPFTLAMTVVTILLQQRLDVLLEDLHGRPGCHQVRRQGKQGGE